MVGLYQHLASSEILSAGAAAAEDDEQGLLQEDLRGLRVHKRIERNRTLAARVKKLRGFTWEVCGFNFEERYGKIGAKFIEAHHLQPIAQLKGVRVTLDRVATLQCFVPTATA